MGRTATTWGPGQGGKPKGAKDRYPRSAKRAVELLLERFGNDEALIAKALRAGLAANPPASFPYLKLVIEQIGGAPEQPVSVVTKIINEIHEAPAPQGCSS